MTKKQLEYYIGIVLTGIVATLLIPVFIGVVGVIRLAVLLWDSLSLPYNAMTKYDNDFHSKYEDLEALKRN